MDKDKQRVAIAEACGWEHRTVDGKTYWWNMAIQEGELSQLPDYLNDLNAMHEALLGLSQEQREEVALRVCWGINWKSRETHECSPDYLLACTSEELAEAFLKTLNLWTD